MKYEHKTAIVIKNRKNKNQEKIIFCYKAVLGIKNDILIIQYYESRIADNGTEFLLPFKEIRLWSDEYALIIDIDQLIDELKGTKEQ